MSPRGRPPLDFEKTRRAVTFKLICNYAADHGGLPAPHLIYKTIVLPKMPGLKHRTFRDQIERLVEDDHKLQIDHVTGAISIVGARLVLPTR